MAVALGVALIAPVRSQDASRDLPARIRAWVDAYERQLPSIVAEERYEQKVSRLRRGGRDRYTPPPSSAREVVQQRVLESEFLLVKPANGFEWIPFRDVIRVDGQIIRDRADRLARLLLDPTASSYDAAARIGEESTRYNIGGLVRTVNVPTLALAFLTTRNAKCCKVKVHDLDTIEGERFQRMSFDETVVPGIVGTKEGRRVKTKGGWELGGRKALRKGDWKIVYANKPWGSGEWELYDIARDRAELHDLARKHPDKLAELLAAWKKYVAENGVIEIEGLADRPGYSNSGKYYEDLDLESRVELHRR